MPHKHLDHLERYLDALMPHRLPLLRAVRAGTLAVIEPAHVVSGCGLDRCGDARRPLVVLIGDDDYTSAGPAGWRCAARLARWARFALIHGAGGEPEHYEMAVELAVRHHRLALIETSAAFVEEWAALFLRRRVPSLGIAPPAGQAHPAPVAREALQ